jgi:hypothetical protein
MTMFYLLLGLAALVTLALILSLRAAWRRRRSLPYTLGEALFSPEERVFLAALDEAVGDSHRVYGKVRLSDLATLRRGTSRRALEQAQARIADLRIDFLVCSRESARVVCAVELIPAKGRHGGNKALARACEALALPLVRVPAAESYPLKSLTDDVQTAMYAPKVKAPEGRLRGGPADDGLSRAEEEQALSILAASIRDGEPLVPPRGA